MTLAAGGAVALGAAPLGAVFDEWRWVWYAWAAIAAVVGAHLLARSLRLPTVLVPLAGALGLLLYLTAVFGSDGALLGLLPTPDSLAVLRTGLRDGLDNVNEYAAPVPVTDGLLLLTAAALGGIAIGVDIVAVSFRRPAASGLALLALYAVPTAVVLGGVPWILFAIAAAGYLMLLLVEGRDRLLHWGRPVAPAPREANIGDRIAARAESDAPAPLTGQRIGAAAIALAVILPLLIPGMTGNALNRLGSGSDGSGTGGTGPLNEFAALRGELVRGAKVDLMRVTTNLDPPAYLRTSVLETYQSSGFRSSGTSGKMGLDDGPLSVPAGQVADSSPIDLTIRLTDKYDDDHLPVNYVPTQITGAGDGWRWDPDRGVVVNRERRGDLQYEVKGAQPTPSVAELEASPPLSEDELNNTPIRLIDTPNSLPQKVRDTVTGIIDRIEPSRRASPYWRAKAINDYLTSKDFSYATNTIQGNSGSQLADFLTNKVGYCEQYAAAMAIMMRLVEIPSRVVIGYTPGTRNDDGTWTVTTHDAHAWVEGYFSGIGWTYFDPTPLSDGRTVAPGYAPRPTASATPSSSASGASGSAGPTANQLPAEDLDPGVASDGTTSQGLVTPRRLLVTLIVLAGLLLLLLPAGLRLASRRRRLRTAAGADPDAAARAAWDEVVGTAADYGVPVPASETPRGTARRLDRDLSLDADASRGLRLVALAEERSRYAARAGVDGDLPAAVRAVRSGLREEVGRRQRWRATLLPPSTVRAARSGSAIRAASASTALSRLGETVRRPVTPRRR